MELQAKIEGFLFYKGEDVSIKKLAELFGVSMEEIETAVTALEASLAGRGITLMKKDGAVMLGVAAELSELIESIRKDEITKELSKATLETLSVILYKSGTSKGVTRSEIDYIRGVNSSFILRNLLIRGLIEKGTDPSDARRLIYKPTFEALSYMGVTAIEALPNYAEITTQLQEVITSEPAND